MKLRYSTFLIAGIALVMMIAGCGGGSRSNTPNSPAAVFAALSPQPRSSIDAGSTTNLTAVMLEGIQRQ